jgi:hypothetical protein
MEGRDAIGIEMNADISEFKKEPLDLFKVAQERLAGISDTTTLTKSKQSLASGAISKFLATRTIKAKLGNPYGIFLEMLH